MKRIIDISIFVISLLGCCALKGSVMSIELNDNVRDIRLDASSTGQSYYLSIKSKSAGNYLLIQSIPPSAYIANVSMLIDFKTVVVSTMLHVHPLRQKENIHVTINFGQLGPSSTGQTLRIVLMSPQYCLPDMLCLKGRRYVVSAVPLTAKQAMTTIRGHAQLASFTSISEIEELIAANNDGLQRPPYRRKINLRQVRVGMFRGNETEPLIAVTMSGSACTLAAVQKYKDFLIKTDATGHCILLKDQGSNKEALLELNDCSRPTLSLISFPMKGDHSSHLSSSCHSKAMIDSIEKLSETSPVKYNQSVNQSSNNSTIIENFRGNSVSKKVVKSVASKSHSLSYALLILVLLVSHL